MQTIFFLTPIPETPMIYIPVQKRLASFIADANLLTLSNNFNFETAYLHYPHNIRLYILTLI